MGPAAFYWCGKENAQFTETDSAEKSTKTLPLELGIGIPVSRNRGCNAPGSESGSQQKQRSKLKDISGFQVSFACGGTATGLGTFPPDMQQIPNGTINQH